MSQLLKKKATPRAKTTLRGGFKLGPRPKSAKRRELLYGPDITVSGGCRTVQQQAVNEVT